MLKIILLILLILLSSSINVYADVYEDFRRNQIERDIRENIDDIESTQRRIEMDDGTSYNYYRQQQERNIRDLRENQNNLERLNRYGF